MDALTAFLEFLTAIFAALSTFLGGSVGSVDLTSLIASFQGIADSANNNTNAQNSDTSAQ